LYHCTEARVFLFA